MVQVTIQSLALAAGGILSAGSILIVILLLISDRGWHNGLAYTVGYVGGYTLIGVAIIMIGSGTDRIGAGGSSGVVNLLLVILGTLLLVISWRNRRSPPADDGESPRLFQMLDGITPPRAFGLGAVVTVMNFKNLAIFLSAVSIPLVSELALPQKIAITLLAVLVFCSAVIVPVVIYLVVPERAEDLLTRFRRAIEARRRPIGIWVPLVFGSLFVARGLSGLL